MVKQKKILGIVGAILAIGGGITWFLHLHQYLISVLLWGAAGLILLKLNKAKRKANSKRR
jgi:hypothetical protein